MIVHERRASAILHRLARAARPGHFVVPANVCDVVPVTLLAAGRAVVPVDLSPDTLALDPELCLAHLRSSSDAAGVILVRPYGADIDILDLVARLRAVDPELLIIDDRCLSRPPQEASREELGGVDAVLWSTGYAKYLDQGSGGLALLADGTCYDAGPGGFDVDAQARVEAEVARARASGTPLAAEQVQGAWLDLRPSDVSLSDYQAGIATALPEIDAHKATLEAVYAEQLPGGVSLGPARAVWRHQICVPESDGLVAALFDAGVFASRHYRPVGRLLGAGRFPVAERLHSYVVNLFNDYHFTVQQAELAAATVRTHVARAGTLDLAAMGLAPDCPERSLS